MGWRRGGTRRRVRASLRRPYETPLPDQDPGSRDPRDEGGRSKGFASSHLLEPDLAVFALFPHVPDIIDGRAVALLVVRNITDDRVERHAGMHDFRDLLRIERVRLLSRLLDDLDRGIGIERVALRVEPLGLERSNRILRVGVLARLGTEGHERSFDARTPDRRELAVGDAVAGDHDRLHALVAHLTEDEAAFG